MAKRDDEGPERLKGDARGEGLYSVEAEENVIGSLLLDPDAIIRIAPMIEASDFSSSMCRTVFQACLDLHHAGAAIDLSTVAIRLQQVDDYEDVGGHSTLVRLLGAVPSATNVEHYANIVEDYSVRRRVLASSGVIATAAYEHGADDASIKAHTILMQATERKRVQEALDMPAMVRRFYEADRQEGVSTGLIELDNILGGIRKKEYLVLAARPSMGKSAFMSQLAQTLSRAQQHVGIHSLEMSADHLFLRMLSSTSGIPMHALFTGKERGEDDVENRLRAAAEELERLPMFIDDTVSINAIDLRHRVQRNKHLHGIDVVMIDYLQLLKGMGKGPRHEEVAEMSRQMRAMAGELDVTVIAVAQLNRGVEGRGDKRPAMHDLRESGQIEQDADGILFLHRPGYYDREEDQGLCEVIVAKQRNGPIGTAEVCFDLTNGRFGDRDPESDGNPF